MDRGFLEQDEIDALDRQEILQIIKERRLIFVRNNEGRVDCATVEEFRELLSLSLPRASQSTWTSSRRRASSCTVLLPFTLSAI
jgi:hypothetical protein